MIDLTFRCFSRDRWIQVATNRDLYDADGNPSQGVAVDELGHIQIAPGTYDAQGNEITPPTIDTWYWVNLRLHSSFFADDEDEPDPGDEELAAEFKFFKSKLVKFVKANGTPKTVQGQRVYEFGTGDNRIWLLDPRDIGVPYRIWADGMSY